MSNDCVQTINPWVKNIAIHCKTMCGSLIVWRDGPTKPIKIYELICIVVLKYTSNCLNNLEILVLHRVKEM
jgi:hypothetical protein